VPTDVSFGGQPNPSPEGGHVKLSLPAMIYLVAVAAGAMAVAVPFVSRLQTEQHGLSVWAAFVLLGGGAAIAQVLLVKHPPNQSYHATNVFLIPAILLLPPELVVVVAIVQHIPAWLKNRTAWYRECFNI